MTKQHALSLLILKKIADGMTAAEAMDATFGPGTFDKLASDVYDKLQPTPGLKLYTPEMGEPKPAAHIEAHLAHYGEHYFLKSQIELKGRGVTFLRILKASDLKPAAQAKVGWHEYQVTMRAFERICKVHAVACEQLLS